MTSALNSHAPSSARKAVVAATTDRGQLATRRIVDAASSLFYRNGVNATGLNEIAAESRTGKGQLYYYFDGKPDIVRAVIDYHIETGVLPQREQLEAMRTAQDLRAWAEEAVAQHQSGAVVRCPLGALITEVADNDPALREALNLGFVQWRDLIARGLTQLQDNGVLKMHRSAENYAEILLCAYEGGVILSEVHGDPASLELSLAAAIDGMLI